MNFEDFKNKVSFILRKKEEKIFTKDEIYYLFKKNMYNVDEVNIIDNNCFKAKVNKIAWLSSSKENIPHVYRDIVGRRIGKEVVLLIDEIYNENKYNYFEILDEKYDVKKRLWLGDFLKNVNDYYYDIILNSFKDDLSYSFLYRLNEEEKVLKKKIL